MIDRLLIKPHMPFVYDPQRSTYWYGEGGGGKVTRVSERCVYGYWKLAVLA